jgi:hypothetical protein
MPILNLGSFIRCNGREFHEGRIVISGNAMNERTQIVVCHERINGGRDDGIFGRIKRKGFATKVGIDANRFLFG